MRTAIQMDSQRGPFRLDGGASAVWYAKTVAVLLLLLFFFKSLLLKRQFLSQACRSREKNKESKNRIRWKKKAPGAGPHWNPRDEHFFCFFFFFFFNKAVALFSAIFQHLSCGVGSGKAKCAETTNFCSKALQIALINGRICERFAYFLKVFMSLLGG